MKAAKIIFSILIGLALVILSLMFVIMYNISPVVTTIGTAVLLTISTFFIALLRLERRA